MARDESIGRRHGPKLARFRDDLSCAVNSPKRVERPAILPTNRFGDPARALAAALFACPNDGDAEPASRLSLARTSEGFQIIGAAHSIRSICQARTRGRQPAMRTHSRNARQSIAAGRRPSGSCR
jgi:hypothetical protein